MRGTTIIAVAVKLHHGFTSNAKRDFAAATLQIKTLQFVSPLVVNLTPNVGIKAAAVSRRP